ncbi:hypothetical protein [Promicromonospora panici]|uniref:hypothetical protein n=1 Tax=Promicromonospora panici TaxID=2219658 RepID=UPI00101D9D43|nr:hypothetical protein [Promicromonospora panici]
MPGAHRLGLGEDVRLHHHEPVAELGTAPARRVAAEALHRVAHGLRHDGGLGIVLGLRDAGALPPSARGPLNTIIWRGSTGPVA